MASTYQYADIPRIIIPLLRRGVLIETSILRLLGSLGAFFLTLPGAVDECADECHESAEAQGAPAEFHPLKHQVCPTDKIW